MSVSGAAKVFAVLGDPVSHSLSPVMHNGWFADHGLDAVYVPLRLSGPDPAAAIRSLKDFNLAGMNVTTPHKAAAAKAADRCEAETANVLRREPDGSLSGFNTDGQGFLDALGEIAPDWRGRVGRVLIIGAGGAALSIGQALSPKVDGVYFCNRTAARAEAAAASIRNGRLLRWEDMERGFGAADLIVQATTLGMAGQASADWPFASSRATAIAMDIVYRPLETPFLAAARRRGLTAADGLGMLIHQGVRAFELWFDIAPDAGKARARLLAALEAP